MPVSERSLANLIPFKPGESGNPDGIRAAGASVKQWWNALQNTTRTELEAIVDDPDAPSNKVSAAIDWLIARSKERTTSGQPINGPALTRIIEHTDGKAMNRSENVNIEVQSAGQIDLEAMMQDLITLNIPRETWPPQVAAFAERQAKQIESKVVE